MNGFLYGKTEYNKEGKSILLLNDYVLSASKYYYGALSITGSDLAGAYKFYKMCKENKVTPIIGLELNVAILNVETKLLAYAINEEGYYNLIKLNNEKYWHCSNSLDELINLKGIFFVSTFDYSLILSSINSNDYSTLDKILNDFNKLEYFGIGISLNNKSNLAPANILYNYAKENGIKTFPLCQTLYKNPEDYEAYNEFYHDDKKENYHYPKAEELVKRFKGFEDVFYNFGWLVNQISYDIKPINDSIKFSLSSFNYLKKLCDTNFAKMLSSKANNPEYKDRLNKELTIIKNNSLAEILLINYDLMQFAINTDIAMESSTNNLTCSLVSYLLGLTPIDPIEYGLYFECMINQFNPKCLNINYCVEQSRIEDVKNYINKNYGERNVFSISKCGKINLDKIDETLQEREYISKISNLVEVYKDPYGIYILSDNEKTKIPVGGADYKTIQLEKNEINELGVSGIYLSPHQTLGTYKKIVVDLTSDNLSFDDKKTYDLFNKVNIRKKIPSIGIYKASFFLKFKPKDFNEFTNYFAFQHSCYSVDEYLEAKKRKITSNINPILVEILKDTNSFLLYIEQFITICNKIAGMTIEEANIMFLKLRNEYDNYGKEHSNYKLRFIECALNICKDEEEAESIFKFITSDIERLMPKSRVCQTALRTYEVIYAKANFPEEYEKMIRNI